MDTQPSEQDLVQRLSGTQMTIRFPGGVMCVGFKMSAFCDQLLDLSELPRIQRELENLLQDVSSPHMVLDLHGFEYLPTIGLGMIVGIHSKVSKRGGELRVACPNRTIRDLFTLTKLDRVFKIYDSSELAIESFKSAASST